MQTLDMTRREFLRTTTGLAVALGLGSWLPGCGSSSSQTPSSLVPSSSSSALDLLARSLQGPLLRPGAPGFAQAAQPWNLRFASVQPTAIARCASVTDMQTSLQWAMANQVPFVVRSGGHSYAGYSTTTGLMIDVSPLTGLSFDQQTGQVTVQAGAHNANLYASLPAYNVAVTHGRCPPVGVSGLLLGGGIGFNMRLHGLTCDQLVETQVLTASGQLLTCNAQQNEDLFWACQGGGGGNFGINTSFTLQTFPVDTMTVFQITWTDSLPAVLPPLLQVLISAPNELGCKVSVTVQQVNGANQLAVSLLGQIHGGSSDDVRALLGPVYQVASPSMEQIQLMAYWDAQNFLSETTVPMYVHERSQYVFGAIPQGGLDTIFQFLQSWPGTSQGANWKMFLQGGAVAQVAPDATAFVHRQASMISSIELDWDATLDSPALVAQNEAWLTDFHQAMAPFTSAQSYQNFIDGAETDYLTAYYGANLARLIQVKQRYDPGNVFNYPQSIPTSSVALRECVPA